MATITLKGVDETLLENLKQKAKKNRRSLNQEIIYHLEKIGEARPLNYEEIMTVVNKCKPKVRGKLTEIEIENSMNQETEWSF